jgi:aminoglycoside phosphotransferase (APT) family kinase protein
MVAVPVEPAAITHALNGTFPELHISSVRVLGAGFNSIAVETDGGAVFRIAKVPGIAERYEMEQRLLPALEPLLPVAVPRPTWFARTSERLPHGATGYPALPGRVLTPDMLTPSNTRRIAHQTATLLRALDTFPTQQAMALGVALPGSRAEHYVSLRDETGPALRERLTAHEFAVVSRWWDSFLGDEALRDYPPVLVHGDLWYENLLVDDGARELTGVIDWEHAALFDRAQDVATLLHLGREFTSRVLETYRSQGGTFGAAEAHRAPRYWELRHFYGVLFGVRFHDEPELEDAIRKLRAGPLFAEEERFSFQ